MWSDPTSLAASNSPLFSVHQTYWHSCILSVSVSSHLRDPLILPPWPGIPLPPLCLFILYASGPSSLLQERLSLIIRSILGSICPSYHFIFFSYEYFFNDSLHPQDYRLPEATKHAHLLYSYMPSTVLTLWHIVDAQKIFVEWILKS